MGIQLPSRRLLRSPSSESPSQKHRGAALIAKPTLVENCSSRIHIISYIRAHYESWLEFAASSRWDLQHLRAEDIVFVSGTTMTTHWAMVAYQGQCDNSHWAKDRAAGLFDGADTDTRDPTQPAPSEGPSNDPSADIQSHCRSQSARLPENGSQKPDQCLFIHYYKVKRRMWKFSSMAAAAGPHRIAGSSSPEGPPRICTHGTMGREGRVENMSADGSTQVKANFRILYP